MGCRRLQPDDWVWHAKAKMLVPRSRPLWRPSFVPIVWPIFEPRMAVAVDASTPIRWSASVQDNGGTMTSASFTAPTNAFLLATVQFDGADDADTGTFTLSDSGGLTWTTRVTRTATESTTGGGALIATARTTSAVARTATVTRNAGAASSDRRTSAKLYVLTGVDVDGTPFDTVGAGNENGSTTNSINTTSVTPGANGLLVCSDCDWNALGAFEASSDLTQDTDHYAGFISVVSGYKTCSSGVGVTGNLNAAGSSAAQHKWVQLIVREAATAALPRQFRYRGQAVKRAGYY